MTANRFVDPRTGLGWDWPRNHAPDGAGERGIQRSIDHGATTGGTAVVRQQGADQPMTLPYTGLILDSTMHGHMVAWAKLGEAQTIYFYDACGDGFEVLVTTWKSAPFSLGNTVAWNYTLEMEVITVLTGTWTSTTTGGT